HRESDVTQLHAEDWHFRKEEEIITRVQELGEYGGLGKFLQSREHDRCRPLFVDSLPDAEVVLEDALEGLDGLFARVAYAGDAVDDQRRRGVVGDEIDARLGHGKGGAQYNRGQYAAEQPVGTEHDRPSPSSR